jgi:hypothetical protein
MYYTMPRPIFLLVEDSIPNCVTQKHDKPKQKAKVIERSRKLKNKTSHNLYDSPQSISANTSKMVRGVAHTSHTGGRKCIQYFCGKLKWKRTFGILWHLPRPP